MKGSCPQRTSEILFGRNIGSKEEKCRRNWIGRQGLDQDKPFHTKNLNFILPGWNIERYTNREITWSDYIFDRCGNTVKQMESLKSDIIIRETKELLQYCK